MTAAEIAHHAARRIEQAKQRTALLTGKTEPPRRSGPCHQAGAALGVWACSRSERLRNQIKTAKSQHPYRDLEEFALPLTELIREWSGGALTTATVVTCPPRGASCFGATASWPYFAEALARETARMLALEFCAILERTDLKRWHGPWHSLEQKPYLVRPAQGVDLVIVVDDMITSGRTMRLALEAIRRTGVMAFGFAHSGH